MTVVSFQYINASPIRIWKYVSANEILVYLHSTFFFAKFYGIVGTISWYNITPSHLRSTISEQFSMGRQKKNRTF